MHFLCHDSSKSFGIEHLIRGECVPEHPGEVLRCLWQVFIAPGHIGGAQDVFVGRVCPGDEFNAAAVPGGGSARETAEGGVLNEPGVAVAEGDAALARWRPVAVASVAALGNVPRGCLERAVRSDEVEVLAAVAVGDLDALSAVVGDAGPGADGVGGHPPDEAIRVG